MKSNRIFSPEDDNGCWVGTPSEGTDIDWEWLDIVILPNFGEFKHIEEVSLELKHTHCSKP
jgi:hypothetical protein